MRKLRRELQVTKLENEEFVQAVNQLKNELANEKFEVELVTKRENELKEKARQLMAEIDRLREKALMAEEDHKKALDLLKLEHSRAESRFQSKIEK